jgi:hypothetical protein
MYVPLKTLVAKIGKPKLQTMRGLTWECGCEARPQKKQGDIHLWFPCADHAGARSSTMSEPIAAPPPKRRRLF